MEEKTKDIISKTYWIFSFASKLYLYFLAQILINIQETTV